MTQKSIAPKVQKPPAGYRFAQMRGRSNHRLVAVDRRTGQRRVLGVPVTRRGHFAAMDRLREARATARYGFTTGRAKRRREKERRATRKRAQRQMGRAA